MDKTLVVGAGFMGAGIGQVCAQAGYEVHLVDINNSALEKAMAEIRRSLEKLYNKNLLKEPPAKILERIILNVTLKVLVRLHG